MRHWLRHFLLIAFLVPALAAWSAPELFPGTNNPVVLTNAAQVRALTREEAARRLPIRIRGVVVLGTPQFGQINMLDNTAGIYVEGANSLAAGVARGEIVEVEGTSNPGKFAPYIDAHAVRKIGKGSIPEPPVADRDDLLSGRLDAQWIQVSGVVRRVLPGWKAMSFEVELGNGGGRIFVRADGERPLDVDSTVRLRGVCYYQFNQARQALHPQLAIPAGEPIVVIEPAVKNLAKLPVRSIDSLMQFSVSETYVHRIRVRGAVIYSEPDDGFWLHDSSHGIHVLCDEKNFVAVGTEVDVFGFVKTGEYGPVIEDAIFQPTGKTLPLPLARLNKASDALDHDSDLVSCEAVIQEQWNTADGCRLRLTDGTTEFPAILRTTNQNAHLPRWRAGTRVRLTGLSTVGFLTKPTGVGTIVPQFFQILLRSPEDVVVLQLPSWWDAEHVAWVTGGVAVFLLLVVALVIWISRRRLREEALERMKSEAEFAAVWNERNRMAREMHDTLAQGLTAISMQLELLKRHLGEETTPRQLLEVARQLVREKMVEARNAIWNVRSQVLENGDLATALGNILRGLTDGAETKGELRVRGRVRRLSPVAENNLLRIGQEAITNAAKYAQARNILVALEFEPRELRLSVSDDGKGFDVKSPPPSEGGFGLNGMRERAAQIHAEFSVASEPGEGTIVTLVLPLSS